MAHQKKIVAVTGHPTGAVHALMAKEALEHAASERGVVIRVETRAPGGVLGTLMPAEIDEAAAVIIASDEHIDTSRFSGKPLVFSGIAGALSFRSAGELVDRALGLTDGAVEADSPREPDFVSESSIFFAEGFSDRDELLDFVSRSAVMLGYADDAAQLKAAFLKREAEGATGMLEGFAIPHAKSPTVRRASVIVVRDDDGVEGWETMDGRPVTVAIALLIPEGGEGSVHLKLLSRIAEALMDEDFRSEVKQASDPAAIAAAINARLS